MPTSLTTYNTAKKKFLDADIDWVGDNIRGALLTSAYTPDIDTDEFWDDVSANEISADGYPVGGILIENREILQLNSVDYASYKGLAPQYHFASQDASGAKYFILYKDTGDPTSSALICYGEFASDATVEEDGSLTLIFSSLGWFKIA